MSFEVLSSTERNFSNNFSPNYFVKLNKRDLEKKKKALKCYKTEYSNFPFPRSLKALEVLANYRGLQCGNEYAEAFQIIRSIHN